MAVLNHHYGKLAASYLFVQIAEKVRAYTDKHGDTEIIKLGIGDVTRPLTESAIAGLRVAAEEMADPSTFRGYGPEQGYSFLREAIVTRDYTGNGIDIAADDVFVSDGSKCDVANFQELFALDQRVAVPDPVYPVYVDSHVMAGRTGEFRDGRYDGLVYMAGTAENGFVPPPPSDPVDLLYLCFPNNPTGATATHEQLRSYVEYAKKNDALILFDAAYAEFIRDESLPRSIYEVAGAQECAVEFRSFSKTAGFTGLRCAYTVVPRAIEREDSGGARRSLRDMWLRRQSTKFNGASYPIQRAAAAVYSDQGSRELRALTDYYLANAAIIRQGFSALGYTVTGGDNSPYVWIETGDTSWDMFDTLLHGAGVVITPGVGFGSSGEGYIRVSAFNDRDKVETAIGRITKLLQ